MDKLTRAALRAFVTRLQETQEWLRTELNFAGEHATIRRVLDHGSPEERGVLLIVLGHAEHIVLKPRARNKPDDERVRSGDERATRFLRGLIGEGDPLSKETLRPPLECLGDGLFVLAVGTREIKPFTIELAQSLWNVEGRPKEAIGRPST